MLPFLCETTFGGDVGALQRRHLKPKGCVYVGKEANKIEMQKLESNRVRHILNLTPAEARKIEIEHRSTLKQLKGRDREGDFNINTKEMKKVLKRVTTL
jgi:hypothetical protein